MNGLESSMLKAHIEQVIQKLEKDIKQYLWNVADLTDPPTGERDRLPKPLGAASIEAYWRMQTVNAMSLIGALKTVLKDYHLEEKSCL